MGKRWVRLIVIVPLLVFFVFTNVYEDPANIFHDNSKEMAELLSKGYATYNTSDNGNEREIKHNMIMLMPDEVDCVAIGPSLIMTVNKDEVGTDSFINLGVSGSDLYDVLAQFGLMKIYDKKPKKVILCVDSYFFDESFYNAKDARNKGLKNYAEYMLEVLEGENPKPVSYDYYNYIKTRIEQAFSITYFQAAWKQIQKNGKYIVDNERYGVVGANFNGEYAYYDSDASLVYEKDFQEKGVSFVKKECANYNIKKQFAYDKHINKYSMEVFEKLICYMQEQGIEVELFLCPMSPSLWDRIDKDKSHYPILDEISGFAYDMSNKYNLKIIGTYNPYKIGMKDEDFYDARHVRRELMGKFFEL